MLTAITLENFKSYRSARLPLAPLTVKVWSLDSDLMSDSAQPKGCQAK